MDYDFEKITTTEMMYQVALHLKDNENLDDDVRKQLIGLLDAYETETPQYTSFSLILKLYNYLRQFPISERWCILLKCVTIQPSQLIKVLVSMIC